MKLLGRLIAIVSGIVVLVLVAFYVLLQTQWGARQLSQWVSNNTSYQVAFSKMEHSWSTPDHLIFNDITLGNADQPATVVAKKLDIGLSSRQFTNLLDVDSISLQQGSLTLQDNTPLLPLKASRLRLQDMNIEDNNAIWPVTLQRANGGIVPWQPEANNLLGKKANIEFSADAMTLKGIPASHVLLQGSVDNGNLVFSTMGADIARGSLTGNIRRSNDGVWTVSNLRLNDIRLQTDKPLTDFLAPLSEVASINIERLDVIGARLEGPAWAISDLDLSLQGTTLTKGNWNSEEGTLSANAREFIWNSVHLQDPIINADLNPQGLLLRQFSSRWEGGMVRANGQWLRDNDSAIINEMVFTGLEYTLPIDWKALWMQPLPEWLSDMTIKKLSANRNLIIDINPDWPFQLTALDATATNLLIARHHQWGLWDGKLSLNAANATFNRVDIRRPSLTLDASPQQITVSELSGFRDKGILEATATISQTPQRVTAVELKGQGVPVNTLKDWGWPSLPLDGEGNLSLSASGQLAADTPLRPTVNATLRATDAQGQQIQQTMRQGVVALP
ncbi:AsmA family protein [uncultured Cedecea sp.]|uniref:AsmA family protein n=1 Tax=uncultured Cedecea sp. TaxID=988762 RepID=UPI0026320509|nr:AsmA family protein [uncultured Cedecea sp.]